MTINMTVPACSIGEVPRDEGNLCQKCDPRSFSLWQDEKPLKGSGDKCTYGDLDHVSR